MANVCLNYITITGEPEILDIIAHDYIGYNKEDGGIDFNFGIMSPVPQDIEDDYSWRLENWGNKWDGTDHYIDIYDDLISMEVSTAWSPCDKWIYKLIELCPGVNIYHEYYESGEGYIGWIQHYENEGPEEYEEVCYTFSSDSYNYWLTVFEKEYETFDWLSEHVEDLFDDELITRAETDEILQMINDNTPLEILIAHCIELDIL